MLALRIRAAVPSDLPRLTAIYNHYVSHTAITFDIEPFTVAQRASWFEQHAETGRYRLLVAEDAGRVVGYAGTGPFRPKRAYETTVETTIYCAPDATGCGIGTRLYVALFDLLRGEDVHRALAGITLPNPPSIALHQRFGFVEAARFNENGRKLGRYWDVAWFEKRLG
ncbi:MAG TPA: GNAT family N-acetyltransferase [Burkholderiales bacterium]|nr:GNAT family N-acetyltransferase [Burkholderiales bacterium]